MRRIAGEEAAQQIQLMIEYDPQPPYSAGGPKTVPKAMVDLMRTHATDVPRLQP